MKTCPACQQENQPEAIFCNFCGAKLSPAVASSREKHCPHCGKAVPSDAMYCPFCSRPVTRAEPVRKDTTSKTAGASKGVGCGTWLVAGLILLVLIMAFTNPSRKDHESEIYRELGQAVGETLGGPVYRDPLSTLGGLFGQGLGTLTNLAGISPFDYQSYLIFSTTSFNGDPLTLGIFGNVSLLTPVDQWSAELQSAIEQLLR